MPKAMWKKTNSPQAYSGDPALASDIFTRPLAKEDNLEMKRVIQIMGVTWIVFWALLITKYHTGNTTPNSASAEEFDALFLLLSLAGFPLSLVAGLLATGILFGIVRSGSSIILGAMALGGLVQWYFLVPFLWRVFLKGKELKW